MKSSSPSWDPQASVGFWLNHASRLLMRRHESVLKPLGFGMGHLPVLVALDEGEALSQKELAQRAHVEQGTMAEQMKRMERDGVIERTPSPSDKRVSLTRLTARSKKRLPKAKEALGANVDVATRGFTADERRQLMELLQRVVANLTEV